MCSLPTTFKLLRSAESSSAASHCKQGLLDTQSRWHMVIHTEFRQLHGSTPAVSAKLSKPQQ